MNKTAKIAITFSKMKWASLKKRIITKWDIDEVLFAYKKHYLINNKFITKMDPWSFMVVSYSMLFAIYVRTRHTNAKEKENEVKLLSLNSFG